MFTILDDQTAEYCTNPSVDFNIIWWTVGLKKLITLYNSGKMKLKKLEPFLLTPRVSYHIQHLT